MKKLMTMALIASSVFLTKPVFGQHVLSSEFTKKFGKVTEKPSSPHKMAGSIHNNYLVDATLADGSVMEVLIEDLNDDGIGQENEAWNIYLYQKNKNELVYTFITTRGEDKINVSKTTAPWKPGYKMSNVREIPIADFNPSVDNAYNDPNMTVLQVPELN